MDSIKDVRHLIEVEQERLQPYMPLLTLAIFKTYVVPFGGLILANVIVIFGANSGTGLFTGLIGSTASVLLYFAILYFGWRYGESRWGGTGLFVLYTAVSKARRLLEAELETEPIQPDVVNQYAGEFAASVDALITAMQDRGMMPEEQ